MNDSIVLVDKPAGITSFDVIKKLRKITGIKRIGHAGVLDKMATGLLICATGRATRLLSIFEDGYKIYEAEFLFGLRTDTFDISGRVIEKKPCNISSEDIKTAVNGFIGAIQQMPPPFSNVKVAGKRLYKYALKNEQVNIKPRTVIIKDIEILSVDGNIASLRITCSKGTYIRSLANDLGEKLQCGCVVKSLKRTYIHPFSLKQAGDPDNPRFLKLSEALFFIPRINVGKDIAEKIKNGANICRLIFCENLKEDIYAVFDNRDNLVAVIERNNRTFSYKGVFI